MVSPIGRRPSLSIPETYQHSREYQSWYARFERSRIERITELRKTEYVVSNHEVTH
jgi:hypothetical protein